MRYLQLEMLEQGPSALLGGGNVERPLRAAHDLIEIIVNPRVAQPGPAQHDAVAPAYLLKRRGRRGVDPVAVSDDRDSNRAFDLAGGGIIRLPGISLPLSAAV